jgi:hypothetical protein
LQVALFLLKNTVFYYCKLPTFCSKKSMVLFLLWNLWLWVIKAFLDLQNFPQSWQLCPLVSTCRDSMWFLRFVLFVTKLHSVHCHIPPPRLNILERISSSTKFIKNQLPNIIMFISFKPLRISDISKSCSQQGIFRKYWIFCAFPSMNPTHVNSQRVPGTKSFSTKRTGVNNCRIFEMF